MLVVREPNNMFIVYFRGRPVTVYPAGHTRWGEVRDSGYVEVHAWCVGDMREVLQAHTPAYHHHQVTGVWMYISSDVGLSGAPSPPYHDLWVEPAEERYLLCMFMSFTMYMACQKEAPSLQYHVIMLAQMSQRRGSFLCNETRGKSLK